MAAPLGMREQLTFYDEPDRVGARGAQRGRASCSCMDQGGNENAQVYYQRRQRRGARSSPTGTSSTAAPVWAHDGKRVAFYGNDRDSVSYDVYVADVELGRRAAARGRGPAGHLVSARLVAGRLQAPGVEVPVRSARATCTSPTSPPVPSPRSRTKPKQGRHPRRQVRSGRARGLRAHRRGRRVRAAEAQGPGHARRATWSPRRSAGTWRTSTSAPTGATSPTCSTRTAAAGSPCSTRSAS